MHPTHPMPSPFDAFNPQVLQAMSMLASLQNMSNAPIPSGIPGYGAVGPVSGVAAVAGASQDVAVNVPEGVIHPNLELAGDVATLQRELKAMREELNRKRLADDGGDGDDEADLSKRVKRSKKKETEPKKHLAGSVNCLSSQQLCVRSELMVRYLDICG